MALVVGGTCRARAAGPLGKGDAMEMESFFKVRQSKAYAVVEFHTESLMNPLELERIGQGLYRLVDDAGHHQVVLDFSAVKYLSSQAVGIILTMNKKAAQFPEGRLVLCGIGQQLLQLLKITRLDRLLNIVSSQKEIEPLAAGEKK